MSNQVALVTGAASGIGAACAVKLAALGYTVWAVGLGAEGLAETAEAIRAAGGQVRTAELDVTDRSAREALFERIEREEGRLDALVNSAAMLGKAVNGPAIDQDVDVFHRIIEVNLTAVFAFSQLAARLMRKTGKGAIVHISSVGGSAAQFNGSAYCAAKAGLDSLARSMGMEWAKYNIRVNALAPGDISTRTSDINIQAVAQGELEKSPFTRITPLGRQGTPAEMAEVVAFLCSDAASFVTATTVRADGGYLAY